MKDFLLNILKIELKILAKLTLWRYDPTIVGITGNVGKTSAKEAVKTVLGHEKRIRASSKSFNNEIGLPLAILGDYEDTGGYLFWFKVIVFGFLKILMRSKSYPEVLILEYGVDKPGDMDRLLDVARPEIGIVTAMGDVPVHIEFFKDKEAVVREKAKLISQLPATGFAILNRDDGDVYGMAEKTRAHVLTFGFEESADLSISSFEAVFGNKVPGITFKLNYGGSFIPAKVNFTVGRSQAFAAAAGAGAGLCFGMNLVDISEALGHHHTPPGRLRVIKGIKDTWIIDDTYNAAPLAMQEALQSLRRIDAKRKVAVLGDMLELGSKSLEAHERIGELAAKYVDLLITVGMRGKLIREGALDSGMSEKKVRHFDKVKGAGIFLQDSIKKKDLILIKASQGVRLERIVKEVMDEPEKSGDLLVRQSERWLEKKGMYE